jgi:hypothetical protein
MERKKSADREVALFAATLTSMIGANPRDFDEQLRQASVTDAGGWTGQGGCCRR